MAELVNVGFQEDVVENPSVANYFEEFNLQQQQDIIHKQINAPVVQEQRTEPLLDLNAFEDPRQDVLNPNDMHIARGMVGRGRARGVVPPPLSRGVHWGANQEIPTEFDMSHDAGQQGSSQQIDFSFNPLNAKVSLGGQGLRAYNLLKEQYLKNGLKHVFDSTNLEQHAKQLNYIMGSIITAGKNFVGINSEARESHLAAMETKVKTEQGKRCILFCQKQLFVLQDIINAAIRGDASEMHFNLRVLSLQISEEQRMLQMADAGGNMGWQVVKAYENKSLAHNTEDAKHIRGIMSRVRAGMKPRRPRGGRRARSGRGGRVGRGYLYAAQHHFNTPPPQHQPTPFSFGAPPSGEIAKKLCYNCGQMGHHQRQCTKK